MALPFELQALAWPESNRQQMETLVHSSKKEYVKKCRQGMGKQSCSIQLNYGVKNSGGTRTRNLVNL
jgi:hypothetical protein